MPVLGSKSAVADETATAVTPTASATTVPSDPPDEPAPPLRKGERSRGRILDAAAKLLSQQGYTATTLSDIAAAAGMQTGSIYYHFDSKDHVVEEVLAAGVSFSQESISAALSEQPDSATGADNLRTAAVAYVARLVAESDYTVANIRCYSEAPPDIRSRLGVPLRQFVEIWTELIVAGQQDGSIRSDVNAGVQARAVIGLLNAPATWYRSNGELTVAQLAAELADTVVLGLGVSEAAG